MVIDKAQYNRREITQQETEKGQNVDALSYADFALAYLQIAVGSMEAFYNAKDFQIANTIVNELTSINTKLDQRKHGSRVGHTANFYRAVIAMNAQKDFKKAYEAFEKVLEFQKYKNKTEPNGNDSLKYNYRPYFHHSANALAIMNQYGVGTEVNPEKVKKYLAIAKEYPQSDNKGVGATMAEKLN